MSKASAPVLSLRGVARSYNVAGARKLDVLSGVDLDIYPGEIVGLIGPSGSGKSSLLHAAGLLEHPTAGRVHVDGVECTALNERARTKIRLASIGFVYQFHHLLAEFTAVDNVAMPRMIGGAERGHARAEATRLLTTLGLGERLDHQPSQLSGGEQQRVAIAHALSNDPRLLLADEPTGNLDPATSGAVFQSLFDLVRIKGVAALVATHNMALAGFMDRVFAIEGGFLVEQRSL